MTPHLTAEPAADAPVGAYPGKRVLDVLAAGLGLCLLGPFLLLVGALVRLHDGGPALYRQERVGQGGLPFRIWKFRTMVTNADRLGGALTVGVDPRITPLGRLLRHYKLDELPQLVNIIRGEMSLVGPRPEVPGYVARYSADQRAVLALRPGLTDPASIMFWNESELLAAASDADTFYVAELLPRKIALTLAYARGATLWTDLLVVVATVTKSPGLLRRCGLAEAALTFATPHGTRSGR